MIPRKGRRNREMQVREMIVGRNGSAGILGHGLCGRHSRHRTVSSIAVRNRSNPSQRYLPTLL